MGIKKIIREYMRYHIDHEFKSLVFCNLFDTKQKIKNFRTCFIKTSPEVFSLLRYVSICYFDKMRRTFTNFSLSSVENFSNRRRISLFSTLSFSPFSSDSGRRR